jgi:cation-transporting ATPase 13A2
MAQDQVYAGPMSESIPTSITSLMHRRGRHDSRASFTYLQDEDDLSWPDEEGQTAADSELEFEEDDGPDLESGQNGFIRRHSSVISRASVENPLLRRYSSQRTTASSQGGTAGHFSQKSYIVTEDLNIVIAGFKTNPIGNAIYICLCVISFGVAYLLFRWLPRLKIRLIGSVAPLEECKWVVIENEWEEFSIHQVQKRSYGKVASTVFGIEEKRAAHLYDEDDPILSSLRCIDYRYIRFCYNPLKDLFVWNSGWKDSNWTSIRSAQEGLDGDEMDARHIIFGNNLIDIESKTIPELLVDEVLHPFYIFQICSLVLWSLDEYYYYAACIFVISAISIITTLVSTKATMKRLRDISRFECDVRVLRNGFWKQVSSRELVPGDVYEVTDPSLSLFPCDGLLLSGDCIVNESMLTGESVPVSKIPATDAAIQVLDIGASSVPSELTKYFLFSGTKIIRARRPQNGDGEESVALALVLRTGFNTTKGALVRSMLFPKPSGFKFYRDSFKYISVMASVAGIGFIASFVNFVHLKLAWHLIIVRALDLITIVVPPALPATLTIGTSFAISRLKGKQIFCISPQRINVGGKLDVVCFDKTGTLTEDELDVLGVRLVESPTRRFSQMLDAVGLLSPAIMDRDPTIDYETHKAILYTMATCHSLRYINDEAVGDPLDLKMFSFTKWSFEERQQSRAHDDEDTNSLSPLVVRPPAGFEFEVDASSGESTPLELGVLKNFEFVSQLRRASVVVRHFRAQGGDIFVKGAPECMQDICRKDSFPADYEDLLAHYTHRGYRVIACATKHIPKMSWVKVQKMTREEAESDLQFVGFIIFENKLKPATTAVIEELEEAGIRRVMCTGDNILTAISVARECTLINPMAHCFVPHFQEGDSHMPHARVAWESVDNPLFRLDPLTLKPLPAPPEADASSPYDITNLRNYSLAVTGEVFRWVVDFGGKETLNNMLVRGQVFARMSPAEKHELVEKLQSIDYTCGFCGDGANDCGALKAADVGISLSEAEASVAAPFTSRVFDITCVPNVIKDGRAALVTSFSCFKYMSLYSAIQFTTVSFLYASASNLGDFQFLYIDLVIILPVAIFMGWAGPSLTLSRKRPTASLVSRKVLTPLLGQMAICVLIQMIAFVLVRKQSW